MAGLVPAIHAGQHQRMRGGWVYIMTNHANGVRYVGVTSDLSRCAFGRREGLIKGFTKLQTEASRLFRAVRRYPRRHPTLGRARGKSG